MSQDEEVTDWAATLDLVRSDNADLAAFLDEMAAKVNDSSAKEVLFETAFVLYTAMRQALDPEGKVEVPDFEIARQKIMDSSKHKNPIR